MPTIKLTQRAVDALKAPKKGRVEYFDTTLPGFALRITDSGHKSWVAFLRVNRKQVRYTIGALEKFEKVDDARDAARAAFQDAGRGVDPREKRAALLAPPAKVGSVRDLVELYLARHAKPNTKASTYKETKRIFDVDILPAWGDRPALAITKGDALDLLDGITDRGAPI